MIAKIKTCTNAVDIEAAHQNNKKLEEQGSEERQVIPEAEFGTTDLLLDVTGITLAYVNNRGEINVDYMDKSFVLVYEESVWEQIKSRFS